MGGNSNFPVALLNLFPLDSVILWSKIAMAETFSFCPVSLFVLLSKMWGPELNYLLHRISYFSLLQYLSQIKNYWINVCCRNIGSHLKVILRQMFCSNRFLDDNRIINKNVRKWHNQIFFPTARKPPSHPGITFSANSFSESAG